MTFLSIDMSISMPLTELKREVSCRGVVCSTKSVREQIASVVVRFESLNNQNYFSTVLGEKPIRSQYFFDLRNTVFNFVREARSKVLIFAYMEGFRDYVA